MSTTLLPGFAIMASVDDTPEVSFTPDLVLSPIANPQYGGVPFPVNAFSDSPGTITFTILSGPATVQGSLVTMTGAGPVVISCTQTAAGTFGAATVIGGFTILGQTPALTLAPLFAVTYGVPPFNVSATSPSPAPITFSVTGPATLQGQQMTITGAGTITVRASQVATGNYGAVSVTSTFAVAQATPTLTLPTIPTLSLGSQFTLSVTSNSPGAFMFALLSGPGTIAGNVLTVTGSEGTLLIQVGQAATANYTSVVATLQATVT